jgi:hypothetical protein
LRKRNQSFHKRLLGNVFYFGADLLAFAPFVTARRTGRRYGAAYVDYGAPGPVRSTVDIEALRAPDARDEFFTHRAAMVKLSEAVRRRFLDLYRLLPMHLVAACLDKGPVTAPQAAERIPALLDRLRAGRRNLLALDGLGPPDIVEEGTRQLVRNGAAVKGDGLIRPRRRLLTDYFAAALQDGGGPPHG